MLCKPSVTKNDHPDFISSIIQLGDLNKRTHLIDIIQTGDDFCFITTKEKWNWLTWNLENVECAFICYLVVIFTPRVFQLSTQSGTETAKKLPKTRAFGHFQFGPTPWTFCLQIKRNWPFWFCLTRILGTSLEDGPLWPVQSIQLVSQTYSKCPFPFDQIVVPSITLLYLV